MNNLLRSAIPIVVSIACLFALWGCSGPLVGITVVDERTALENQVLGTYQELQQEVLLVASVRYIDPKGKLKPTPPLPPGKKHVIRALQRSAFNKDDVDRFKALGVIGENNIGGITLLAPERIDAAQRAFVENLVKEENEDRIVIMRRVIETNEDLSEQDWPRVQKMFAALNRDKARPGEMIQLADGSWVKKE
ncbi:MAG: DUF1318 domain-containing protein [Nitrospirae bacterium]|nr:MAG: DUF1318 domain-containing protein [Nitrospirota bacterium]